MRDYELLYIIKPEVAEEAIDGIVEKFNGILVKEGATVEKPINGANVNWPMKSTKNTVKVTMY